MLENLLPRSHSRYFSLPLLGKIVGDFALWLEDQGYSRRMCRWFLFRTVRIDKFLRRLGCRRAVRDITGEHLGACFLQYRLRKPETATTANCLRRYMTDRGFLATASKPTTKVGVLVSVYCDYLRDVRGIGEATVRDHVRTAEQFLQFLKYETKSTALATLTPTDIEDFIRRSGKRLSRGTIQHLVARVRSFLRFLATRGLARPDLGDGIDAPLLYRREKPPLALPWESVAAFLQSIDRTTPLGLRDYTMFFLMASYGLRCSEIVGLTLDNVDWRRQSIRVSQRKNCDPLILPLTNDVGIVLLDYLQRGRPACRNRELFLRSRGPKGPLHRAALWVNFRTWLKRSRLKLSVRGPHCLRHSYAVHLLRLGTPLKTIGDLLGHRLVDSTCCYLGLAIDDLREVALPLPQENRDRR